MPNSSGVYWYLTAADQILYIGKAKNLRTRLRSYRHLSHLPPHLKTTLNQAVALGYLTTQSEVQALLLEAELVRLHQPLGNLLLKDDKSFLYLALTKEVFPQLITLRQSDIALPPRPVSRLFGPYPSSSQARALMRLARQIFPYCSATVQDKRLHRACFYYHLDLCPGACLSLISPSKYQHQIRSLNLFLQGRHGYLSRSLKQRINRLASLKQFEAAAKLKSQYELLNTSLRINRLPHEVSLPTLIEQFAPAPLDRLRYTLDKLIHLPVGYPLHRVEMYDIATLSGQGTTAAMVVYQDGQLDRSAYRHFHIAGFTQADDLGSLKQVISRRFNHPKWPFPNVLMVDGGTPQLKAIAKLVPSGIITLALAKRPDRLVYFYSKNHHPTIATLPLKAGDPHTRLLVNLRDEAHRFARRLHLKARDQSLFI